ncbi:hypothetical protein BDZ97DRAFT_1782015 [Flammula alnicola]|nr:hypothetical protein BDZ97DRAFT_1782015 [Flammula alnicola]
MKTPQGPRKGVFVPTTETRQAVIGEERKGGDVPSPHPRFNRGRGRTSVGRYSAVEHLLRKHLLQSIAASNTGGPSSALSHSLVSTASASTSIRGGGVQAALGSSSTRADERCSPLELLFSSAAQVISGSSGTPGQAGDDANGAAGSAICADAVPAEAEPIELDDVLEASFLDDPEPNATRDEGAAAAVKNLSKWDLISVGAFRQTRENGWEGHQHHLHTPGSSADFGSVMKSSPLSSMMWQHGAGGVAGAGARPASASASNTIKGSKLAKRRRLMMSASTMSSPLILPLSAGSSGLQAITSSASSSFQKHTPTSTPTHGAEDDAEKKHQQKSRKELRRERKLMKKKSYGTPQHQVQNHHGHQFHSHNHHPNAKTRSASSLQRSNFFTTSVPPLNL